MKPKPKKRHPSNAYPAPIKIKRAPGTPTKSQIRAAAVAETRALVARWRTLIDQARAAWPKVHAEELAKVDGNFHVLAGLVQMRCQLGRAEADAQVRAFFAKHGLVTKPVIAAAPVASTVAPLPGAMHALPPSAAVPVAITA